MARRSQIVKKTSGAQPRPKPLRKTAGVRRGAANSAGKKPPVSSVLVLINRKSGTVRSRGTEVLSTLIRDALAKTYSRVDVEMFEGDIAPHIQTSLAGKSHDVVIAGGGDGTIASAAGVLMGSGVTMGVLPLGTMNLFVQALGFSANVDEAVKQFAAAKPMDVDVGIANGRPFLHQISFGLQPRMARLREKIGYSSRITKMLAAARAFAILMMRPKSVRAVLHADNKARKVKSPLLIISNNPLGRIGNVSLPVSLDAGRLGLYILSHMSLLKLLGLALDYLRSDLTENPAIDALIVQTVELKTAGNPRPGGRKRKDILSSMDGEVALLENPVTISIRPKSLRVLALPFADGP